MNRLDQSNSNTEPSQFSRTLDGKEHFFRVQQGGKEDPEEGTPGMLEGQPEVGSGIGEVQGKVIFEYFAAQVNKYGVHAWKWMVFQF